MTVELGKLHVWKPEEKRPQSLSLHHWPITMTFGVMNEYGDGISDYVVYDPSVRKIEILKILEIGRRVSRWQSVDYNEYL